MTPEQHNKYLAFSHLAYGTVMALFTLGFVGLFGTVFYAAVNAPAATNDPSAPPPAFFVIFMLIFVAFYAALAIPSFIAGYALLKRKRWAKIASIIGGILAAMFFPIGTAVCVYTFWFLFSEPGKILYDSPKPALPPPPQFGVSRDSINQPEFQDHPSRTPPDWR